MEPITLITSAITIAMPFLLKTGEGFAESIGEDLWSWIKKPFSSELETELRTDLDKPENIKKLEQALLEKINSDSSFAQELQLAVKEAQNKLSQNSQQNIQNQSKIGKQINIQNNTGDIQM